jgi:hypothetical protein
MTSYLSFHVFYNTYQRCNKNKPADWNRVIWQDKYSVGAKESAMGWWRRLKICHSKFINWLHKTMKKNKGNFI